MGVDDKVKLKGLSEGTSTQTKRHEGMGNNKERMQEIVGTRKILPTNPTHLLAPDTTHPIPNTFSPNQTRSNINHLLNENIPPHPIIQNPIARIIPENHISPTVPDTHTTPVKSNLTIWETLQPYQTNSSL